ncbi:MAG: FkbM family methyltransferase [Verrucomicrobiae bacterium]|nr:FkbM family methyltransferase [Verrucomicrobiae bacterium]
MMRPPLLKRVVRESWRRLPPSDFLYNTGKMLTRTLLTPEKKSHPVQVEFAGRFPLPLDLRSFVGNDLYCLDHHYEASTLRLWRTLSAASQTILDLGSHIGTFALSAALDAPHARIFAVEADPENFRKLRDNCRPFPQITPCHAALSESGGSLWFCHEPGNDGGGFVTAKKPENAAIQCEPVQTVSLTELCRTHAITSIDLMKLDVEGLELEILGGLEDFWCAHAPRHVIVELTISKADRPRYAALFDTMARRGYRATRIQSLYALGFLKSESLANWHFERHSN